LSQNKIVAVIPFFNEVKTIREIVLSTLNYVDSVIAVDDGSTDNSTSRLSGIERVILISTGNNTGKGFALKKGFLKAEELESEIVITIDADLQHPPELIPFLIQELGKFDIVIGNRMNDTSTMPVQRIMSNKITSMILSKKTNQIIPDSQCGFRVYKMEVLKNVSTTFCGYEAESEILIFAGRKNFKIGNYPIPTIYTESKSKMNPVKTIIGFIRVIFI
jgi:glycosyltransferase involved in cell wall biosynthesis